MKTPDNQSNNPIHESKNQPAKDWGTLGLRTGFIALGVAAIGLLAILFTAGSDALLAYLLIVLTVALSILLSLAGIGMSIKGANINASTKNNSTSGIVLNFILLLSFLGAGQFLLGGGGTTNNYLRTMAFSPDGKFLATGWHKSIYILDTQTGKRTQKINGHTDSVTFLDYSPDGKTLASASYDGTVRLWDVSTNKELHSFKMDGVLFQGLSYSPDGKTLMAAIQEKGITLIDTTTNTIIKTILNTGTQTVTFSTDGSYVGYYRTIGYTIFNTDGFKTAVDLPDVQGYQFAISRDNDIVAASLDSSIKIWGVSDQKLMFDQPVSIQLPSASHVVLSFSSDNKELAYTNGAYSKGSYFNILNIDTREVVSFGESDNIGGVFPSNIIFSPDDHLIALDITYHVMMWDVNSKKLIWQYP